MKHYKTKTGVYLHCLNGGGQGDGIPRGQLYLVKESKPKNRFVEWFRKVFTSEAA